MSSATDPGTHRFSWRCGEIGSVLHLWFEGELDLQAVRDSGASVRASVAGQRRTVILDTGDVSFMDSSGLELLIRTKRDIEANDGRLMVSRLSPSVKLLVDISQLDTWFDPPVDVEPLKLLPCPVCDDPLSPLARMCDRCGSAV
jgi:anti-anti-sigma factor